MLVDSLGFLRVSLHSPKLNVADVSYNVSEICAHLKMASREDADVSLFPELSISGYTCSDLFYQSALLRSCEEGLHKILEFTKKTEAACLVGLPLAYRGRLYNTAAFLNKGDILGVIPKVHLPNTNEYYEERWFSSGQYILDETTRLCEQEVKFGRNLLFTPTNLNSCIFGVEICEDLWSPLPPSGELCIAGANVIFNLSASNETLGKASYRRELVKNQSARCIAAYLYASSGPNESSTDLVYSGHCIASENGIILNESKRFCLDGSLSFADIDIEKLNHDRHKNHSFSRLTSKDIPASVSFKLSEKKVSRFEKIFYRKLSSHPFVPSNKTERKETCEEIFSIQTTGLSKRLKHVNVKQNFIGVSGGLDSTLALLVLVKSYKLLNWDRKDVFAVTMPGLGTTRRTNQNAKKLCDYLGVSFKEIDICASVKQHFNDINHKEDAYDTVFENSQARERTQILMDLANQEGGLVIGTGDLSELALGWCTYNGDHMSMYNVNSGIPKTLVRYMIEWCAECEYEGDLSVVLNEICSTPITPELLPSDGEEIRQETEKIVGPYELHDFFLYYFMRYGFSREKILFLSEKAFGERYSRTELEKTIDIFYQRFFANQFKRSALPDGIKVGSVSLSPRGDWRMPSDAKPASWLHR